MVIFLKTLLKRSYFMKKIYVSFKTTYFKSISSERLLKHKFKKRLNRELNLKDPKLYNDKLQWLKLNWYNPLATKCADKYEVREYIEEKGGGKFLNSIYGIYNDPEDIDFEQLPKSFVLKGTHGSGFNIICRNKNDLNWKESKKNMKLWMQTNYYWGNREWVYKDIKPRIICEKFLELKEDEEMKDYRIFCFNGKAKFIALDFNINDKEQTRRNLYTLDWQLLDEEISYPREKGTEIPKPDNLEELIVFSERISNPFPHTRIDFYIINNQPIFSEITFFHQSGMGYFNPKEFERTMGDWLKLPR